MSPASLRPDRVARPIHPAVIGGVLRYVEHAAGRSARNDLLARLSPDLRTGDLLDPHRWATRAEVADVVRAAEAVCGDEQIGRRAGEEEFRTHLTSTFTRGLVATGSIEGACRQVAARYGKISLGRRLELVEVASDHLVITSHFLDPAAANRFACDYSAGYFSQLPSLFGALGTVVETECRCRGGARCTFRLAWRPDPSRNLPVEVSGSRADRSSDAVDWFEESQNTAARLVGATDVDALLEEVVEQARQKLQAPRVMLTARLGGDHARRIHHVGFDDDIAGFTDRLVTGTFGADEPVVVTEIASAGHTYGRLAAAFASGTEVGATEHRMLRAYAQHVASALHTLASLERARHDRDTANALLSLARAFSEVTTVDDVASRLTLAVPEVTGCDVATMWLFDTDRRTVGLVGCRDRSGNERRLASNRLRVDDFPELVGAMRSRQPTLLHRDEVPTLLRPSVDEMGVVELALVPIAAKGHLLGLVTAGFETSLPAVEHEGLFERLRGLSAHASTALQNANLLERMRHQALHDTLTGLPNRSLAEDRGRRALAAIERSGNRVGLLFLDLDGFKEVNDTHGHHVGDALIRHVAARLDGLMRVSDTVARMGGDEFVVIMPDVESEHDTIDVATRILAALRRPVHVVGKPLSVSCSIGVASSAVPCPYEELLHRADAAMYLAKSRGGRCYAVDDPTVDLRSGTVVDVDAPWIRR